MHPRSGYVRINRWFPKMNMDFNEDYGGIRRICFPMMKMESEDKDFKRRRRWRWKMEMMNL